MLIYLYFHFIIFPPTLAVHILNTKSKPTKHHKVNSVTFIVPGITNNVLLYKLGGTTANARAHGLIYK